MRAGLLRSPTLGIVVGLAAGGVVALLLDRGTADAIWGLTTLAALVPLTVQVARDLYRGRFGVDLIALLAMAGALLLGQHLAGAVVALMLAGGQDLERYADRRARSELTALVGRTPREVQVQRGDRLVALPIEEVERGDEILVRGGEVVAVDGVVTRGDALLDESSLSGEAAPVDHPAGDRIRSGTVNAGSAFHLRAVATADESTYAGIVRLVEQAQRSKAPLVRLADRYAVVFLPVTLLAASAAWFWSGEPLRALAVLVVATPCPLILAAPVAIVAGISRAARSGVLVKGGGALETLARADRLLLDKTGTLTTGRPVLSEIVQLGSESTTELLRLAATLDLVSVHVLAEAIVREARDRGIEPGFPEEVREAAGSGISGTVDGVPVELGSASWLRRRIDFPPAATELARRSLAEGQSVVWVATGGRLSGALLLEDRVRPDAKSTLGSLRALGLSPIVLLTGDRRERAEAVGRELGIDEVLSEQTPEDKVRAVEASRRGGVTVMVGDGINDAPALAAADVGVAMGVRGSSASSEAADVVLTVDRFERLIDGVRIARRSRRIALQSILAGMGLSMVGMGFAAVGALPPVAGALVQEGIDVAVILNALRALGGPAR